MPRSFLVKKPSSRHRHRRRRGIPDYGQLVSPETNGPCHSWKGMVFPCLLVQGGVSYPPPRETGRLWSCGSIITRLSLPLPLTSEAKGGLGSGCQAVAADIAGGARVSGTPLRDKQNNFNLPSAFIVPPKRASSLASPVEDEGSQSPVDQGEPTHLETSECLGCCTPYHTVSDLARHRQQCCKLQAASRKYFTCKYCAKEYASLGALKMHIRTHTLPCLCTMCGKAFSRPWLLQGHIRTHTGEKPYACSHCNRAFADRSNLRAHLQTHSDIKKYQCHTCSKTFSRMSLLLRHGETGSCPAT